MSELTDAAITILVLLGIFLMGYMAWRQQGLLDTFKEFKGLFEDQKESAKETVQVYQ